MKKRLFGWISVALLSWTTALAGVSLSNDRVEIDALSILKQMSLREKIGQKLMLDFPYWCEVEPPHGESCTESFVTMSPAVERIISRYHIGGIILFSSNLKDIAQIAILTDAFQQAMFKTNNLPLLIGTDQEGGIVTRLPRDVTVNFPGNMAITAAHLSHPEASYSAKVGKIIATNLKAVGINTNFAPDVDVNVNPLNPVINVRSFSDDPKLVAQLGLQFSRAIQAEGVASTLKHFPGHGDTTVDSHIGLPMVSHTVEEAWKIDLYPFKSIILSQAPDIIMTAHIQYPALDNSTIYASKTGEEITTPATLSRKIQYDLLRHQLDFEGIIITDALDMDAIAKQFDPIDATIKAFQAGNDIALMPINISNPTEINKLSTLITKIEAAILDGTLSEKELDDSVLRIIKLKLKLKLFQSGAIPLSERITHAQRVFADPNQYELENQLTDDAMTLIQNRTQLLPIKVIPHTRVHILAPWLEQGAGIAIEIMKLQKENKLPEDLQVSFAKMADTHLEVEKFNIDNADIIIIGNSTTKSALLTSAIQSSAMSSPSQGSLVFPGILAGDSESEGGKHFFSLVTQNELSDAQFAYRALRYAKSKNKKTIFISLLAPYDLPNYHDVADAMLAGYDFYGYLNQGNRGYYRGPSMPAITRIIFGLTDSSGKLPINIPDPLHSTETIYPRGTGLTFSNKT